MKFKETIALAATCLCALSVSAQEAPFTLTVSQKSPNDKNKVFLCYRITRASMKIDSADFVNGKCVINGNTPFAQGAAVYIYPSNANFMGTPRTTRGITVYLEKGNIKLLAGKDADDCNVSGTKLNNDYQEFSDVQAPFKVQTAKMEADFSAAKQMNDNAKMSQLQNDYAELAAKQKKAEEDFLAKHTDSEVSLNWLEFSMDIGSNKSEVESLFNKLSPRLRDSQAGRSYAALIAATPSIEVGVQAPDFTGTTPDGKDVTLQSYRGKYVLIDFWASWCGPCRRENPNVVSAYSKYKSDKFDILGISLDNNKEAWVKAIEHDGLIWTQISDLKAWQSKFASLYVVHSIPANFLIDPNGKIIGMNLRGDTLEKKLSEVLK